MSRRASSNGQARASLAAANSAGSIGTFIIGANSNRRDRMWAESQRQSRWPLSGNIAGANRRAFARLRKRLASRTFHLQRDADDARPGELSLPQHWSFPG